MANSSPDQRRPVKNTTQENSCWLEILDSLKEFSDKIERNDGNVKLWQKLAENITTKVERTVKGCCPAKTGSKNPPDIQGCSQTTLEDVVSRFCLVFFELAIDVKLVRKMHKGSVALSQVYPKIADIIDTQFVVLLSENGGYMNSTQALKLSNLVEGSPLLHGALAKHFPQFLAAMSRSTDSIAAEVICSLPGTVIHPELAACCSALTKLALQIFQLVPLQLGQILGGAQGSEGGFGSKQSDLVSKLSGLVGNLVMIMCCKKFARESGLMCGAALGMLFNSLPNTKDAVNMALILLEALDCGNLRTVTDFHSERVLFNRLSIPPFRDLSHAEKVFGALCFVRGLVTCGEARVLLERVTTGDDANEGQIFLVGTLLMITQELLNSPDAPEFHSTQLFTLWLQCVHRHLPDLRSLINNNAQRFLGQSSDLVQLVLNCIWRHWHSPVDGVPEQIRALFGSLLDSYQAENKLLNSTDDELLHYLAQELIGSPVHLKGRYTLLSTLIPHLGARAVLLLHPQLPSKLLSCLQTHHLVYAANEAYKTLSARLKIELAHVQDQAEVPDTGQAGDQARGPVQDARTDELQETALGIWQTHFLDVVVTGLCNDNTLVRNNIANTWLPCTFKLFPETFGLLMDVKVTFRGGNHQEARDLHRKIILLKQARSCKIIQGHEWMRQYASPLVEAVNHHYDDIRGDAMYLLCHSPKSAEPVSDGETNHVKTLVRNCLNSDNTSLRNQLRISLKALILRLRDSSLPWLKKIQSAVACADRKMDRETCELPPAITALQTKLQAAMELLHWLLEEAFSSLFPGACYQRKRASLDLLRLLYENLAPGKETDAGNASSAALAAGLKKLLSWCQQCGKVILFSERNASLLVNSLLDSSNDIRSSAYDLLIGYFPWPLPSSPANPWSSPSEILVQGMKLICSPKFHECEAGAMLCKLSFHRQMVESCEGMDELHKQIKKKTRAATAGKPNISPSKNSPPVQFVLSLMKSLTYQYKCAQINILRAAALTPMHGIIMSIRKCLTEDSKVFRKIITKEPETWQAILREINAMLHQIIGFILNLLAGRTTASPHSSGSKDEFPGLDDFGRRSNESKSVDADEEANKRMGQETNGIAEEAETGIEMEIESKGGSQRDVGDRIPGMPSTASSSAKQEELSHTSPSFGKMGEEIEKLVSDLGAEDGEDGEDGVAALSLEHQLILSCCWLTLKESSLLMGALAEAAATSKVEQVRILDVTQYELMSKSLVQILTKCRHKGALEGCKIGFFKVCAAMLSCPDPAISSIPKSLLDLVFSVITTTASSTSYTKKSAGLPPLVESIIVAEPRGRERHLLRYTITKLMHIAKQPLPNQPDAKQDLPQSHAINIMRSLFVNSALAWEVLPYAEEAVQLAIDGFASANWMVQNSSMQLLGALIARIFGQKRVQDEHSQVNTLSAPEFFQRYPRLRVYLLQEVRKAAVLHQEGASAPGQEKQEGRVDGGGRGKLHLIPTLHPVLLVLTKLGSGIATPEQKRELAEFIDPICSLASSPIYSVRDLASRAILPLLSDNDEVSNMAAKLLSSIPSSSNPFITSQNHLHGNLMMIQKLLASCIANRSLQVDKVQEITEHFTQHLWVGSAKNPCPLTRAYFMQICMQWWEGAYHVSPDSLSSLIVQSMDVIGDFFLNSPSFQIGLSSLGQKMTTSFISISHFLPDQASNLSTLTHTLLTHDLPEIRELTLEHLNTAFTSPAEQQIPETRTALQRQITELLLVEASPNCIPLALELWVELSKDLEAELDSDWQMMWERLLTLTGAEGGALNSCATALPALSVTLKLLTKDFKNFNTELTLQWCDLVVKCSDPSECETLRLSAAKALRLSGVHVIKECHPDNIRHCDLAFMIMKSGILLLQDEQPEVREEAAMFASLIPREGTLLNDVAVGHLHSSSGLKILLEYVCTKFCINIDFLDTIISLLIGDAFIAEDLIYQETHNNSLNLFEQESVNMYAEGVTEANEVFHVLEHVIVSVLEHKGDAINCWLRERWEFTQFNMAALIKYLDKHPVSANSFYAGTGQSKPYQALARLLLYIRFLQAASDLIKSPIEGVSEAKQKINDHLKSLKKMFYVFPLLKELIPDDLVPPLQNDDAS